MSSSAAENSIVGEKEEEKSMTTAATVTTSANTRSTYGLKEWKVRLMNWRCVGGSTHSNTGGSDGSGTSEAAAAPAEATTEKGEALDQKSAEGSKSSATAPAENDAAAAAAKTNSATAHASPAHPMNIWLRRALERQAESAIAAEIHDAKQASVGTVVESVAGVALGAVAAAAAAAKVAVSEPEGNGAVAFEKRLAAQTRFAELMREHREGPGQPSAQPPVKATKVVKKPKVAEPTSPVVTPTAEKKSSMSISNKKRAAESADQAHAAPHTEPAALSPSEAKKEKAEGGPTQPTSMAEADSSAAPFAAAAVHQATVRKRKKATSSASAKRTQGASVDASTATTPTHVTTVKGKASLEELRARRNRTTAGGSASRRDDPNSSEGSTGMAGSSNAGNAVSGHSQQDEYNDCALDAISRLLLRYCLGDSTAPVTPSAATAADSADVSSSAEPAVTLTAESSPVPTQMTTELEFFNELMELCENDSLTPASLELLRELFQHVRVLPRSSSVSDAGKRGESADASACTVQDGEAAMEETDVEAYREAIRRREYVQQVIMVLLNRLKHMKMQEQRERQQSDGDTAAAATSTASAPLPAPAGKNQRSNTQCAPMPPLSQQHKSGMIYPGGQRMASAAPWPSMAEMAGAYPDEVTAAFTSAMMAYGYPNPYAHLTVFSQHQPVAPPVGWPPLLHTPIPGAHHGRHDHHGSNSNVAARLVASPFPGAFPIIPPPATADTFAGAEDREMQELLRMIRAQLTQPASMKLSGMSTADSRVESSVNLSGAAPVEVSQAERAVLRHVQMDFKKHLEQQQQQQAAVVASPAEGSPAPPMATLTPPPEMDATQARRMHATPGTAAGTSASATGAATGTAMETTAASRVGSEESQHHHTLLGHQASGLEETGEAAGESPSARSTTAPAQEEEDIVTDEATPAKSRGTTLNLNAKPFVPSGARGGNGSTTIIIKPTATPDSTPTKTTFNYHAKPFLPSVRANLPMPTLPQKRAQMNAAAPAFIPKQQQQQQHAPSRTDAPAIPPPPPTSVTDPWASYEMFARWRDMMEAYYQNVFALQNAATTKTGTASPSATATGGGPAPPIMMTSPHLA
ncbi:hypothetical protein Q4I28_001442 [Leishmania naiffi]|uniref:Uncharacterized protein n=1 Tax=Leishmania naiffi TaxID=5678 RepID=A0AAW3C4F1_9TRYP